MLVYTLVGALTFGMLFWFGTSPAAEMPAEECVTVADGFAETGAGILSIYPHVTLYVQPDTMEGRALQGLRDRAVTQRLSIRVCGVVKHE